jgi:hypothetical protein
LIKINLDTTFVKNSGIVTLAAIARDEIGALRGASLSVMEGVHDPEIA